MHIRLLIAASVCASLALQGCVRSVATRQTALERVIVAQFDEESAAAMLAPGTNRIVGNAFMRQQGGGVVTCAGEYVTLIPGTAYAKERVLVEFPSRGTRTPLMYFTPDPLAYSKHQRSTKCDSQGRFTFDDLIGGEFVVITRVTWNAPNVGMQGGWLADVVKTGGGKTTSTIISR